ncbi:unnamed protein product [Linum tenue]|uniref:Uncharacterized protein n=1 Tax=Linum tenue TaxID=586396 RepID=A0AAV0J0K3_9ROSI|nr:unnamed protein product [Linum tenue]CAI0433442.1 unnamed protein product [Linum tenue]
MIALNPAGWRGNLWGSRRIPSSSLDSHATSALLSATMLAPTSSTFTSTSPPVKVPLLNRCCLLAYRLKWIFNGLILWA